MPKKAPVDVSAFAKATGIGPDESAEFFRQFGGLVGGGLKVDSAFTGPVVKILGKTVKDALGTIFKTPAGSGLPKRLRFVNYNTRNRTVHLRADDDTRKRLDISLGQLERMLEEGAIGVDPRPPPLAATMKGLRKE